MVQHVQLGTPPVMLARFDGRSTARLGRANHGSTLDLFTAWLSDWRLLLAFALLLTAAPLLWPSVPPLVDLPNHMSRYRIALDYTSSPYFHRWFDFHWALVGNLGVDLLVAGLAPAIGVEPATKLIVLAIPLLTVAGMALIARETHGRLPATALVAFPLAYSYPFNFGFVNFALSVALSFLAFGLWLRLGRTGRIGWRNWLLLPIGCATWLAHVYGWGLLGMMIFIADLFEQRTAGKDWQQAGLHAVLACLPLAPPALAMIHWKAGDSSGAITAFNFGVRRKFAFLMMSLKNNNAWADMGSIAVMWVVVTATVLRRDMRFDGRLSAVALTMLAAFFVMPYQLMGSGYADMRLVPYAVAMLLLALAPTGQTRFTQIVSLLAVIFFGGRMTYQIVSYANLAAAHERQLEALDHLPIGSRVFGFVRSDCIEQWDGSRTEHLQRLAVVRRQAFANGTWPESVSQTLAVHADMADESPETDSQRLAPKSCRTEERQSVPGMLARLPRHRYDYLWLVDVPSALWPHRPWLRPVWQSDSGILYKIVPAGA